MSELVPRQALAEFTRAGVAEHDDWDGEHEFMILGWENGEVRVRTVVLIPPDVPADAYPAIMSAIAVRELRDHGRGPVAYLLRFEGWMDGVGPYASAEQQEAFKNDPRPIRDRPSRIETCMALCADVHGRMFHAMKVRDNGEVSEMYFAPGDKAGVQAGGRFSEALLTIAHATGMGYLGLPGPPWVAN